MCCSRLIGARWGGSDTDPSSNDWPAPMAATVGSVYISHRFSPFSIYTLRLHQRGISCPYTSDGEPPASQPAARSSLEIAGV